MTSIKKLDKLEAIRGFAALYVVFHHSFSSGFNLFGKDFSFLFRFGQEAVILFFLLSGFVINHSFLRTKDKSISAFLSKRIARIYIPLTIIFLLNFIILYWYNYNFTIKDVWNFFGNILMLQDVPSLKPNVICPPFLGNTPLWSLSYEWWFYVIFIFLFHYIHKKRSILVYVVGTISTLTYIFFPNFLNRELMYLIIWWTGVDLAYIYNEQQEITLKALKKPLLFLGINSILLMFNVVINYKGAKIGVSPFLELRHFIFALLVVIASLIWQRKRWIGFNNTFGHFKHIAPISFVLYISHWFLVTRAKYLNGFINNEVLKFSIYLGVCLLVSYLIERVLYLKIYSAIFRKKSR